MSRPDARGPFPPQRREGTGLFAGLAFLAVTAGAMLVLSLRPPDSAAMAVLFPPWATFEEIAGAVGDAGGRLVRTGTFENIVVARASDPDFAERIGDAGAWAIFDPLILGGCLFSVETTRPGSFAGE